MSIQAEMLGNRLRKRVRHLRKWAKREGVSCYRLYERDIPEVPLVIEWYEGKVHVAEFAAARDVRSAPTGEEHERWLDALLRMVAETLGIERSEVFVKTRERQVGSKQYQRVATDGRTSVVHEDGLEFQVNLSDYLDTGLFLDHRLTRARVRREADGKRVLNLFGYTGAFTVHAAAGGARSTTTVDLSRTYLDWARTNLELNGLSGPRHRLIRADVLRFLADPGRRDEEYDLVVVDPPTFSNSKGMQGHFDVRAHHGELLRRVIGLVSPGGVVYFSTNSRRFRLDTEALPRARIEDITEATTPEDFKGKLAHRCYRLVSEGRATRSRRDVAPGSASSY
jgi:23S rRNA G2069 N7-methylase RlmK/C1962 C5-methylase RlmI